ncbi:MAG: histidine--tRNA ligase [Planctomycetales bacterium]|nr:histidine--tRNA ligase [Planctomycetales bacterium]
MKIQSVKGTRDFYPPQMAVRNFIIDGWKAASKRCGFVEYDGPIFEYLQMYQIKSGQEIVEQLFNFQDRGGRLLAIRPEITPTLARMVNQQINTLPRPVKWFSVPRLCRAERPQKGRLREFFQWNIDIIGADDVLADAEIVYCSLDYLRSAGLTEKDVVARISSRRLLAALLKNIGIAEDRLDVLYPILDKKSKVPAEAFEEMLQKEVSSGQIIRTIQQLMEVHLVDAIPSIVNLNNEAQAALDEVARVFAYLDRMGVRDFCRFDMGIVRGLAYYTGMVFEIHEVAGELRAICGGGRYDNLLSDFGGPKITATGMGMGDCVLEILLRQKGLLKDDTLDVQTLDYFVVCADAELFDKAVSVAAVLRRKGFSCDFSYKPVALGKQLKQADALKAAQCVIVGQELKESNQLVIKDMKSGEQKLVNADAFLT